MAQPSGDPGAQMVPLGIPLAKRSSCYRLKLVLAKWKSERSQVDRAQMEYSTVSRGPWAIPERTLVHRWCPGHSECKGTFASVECCFCLETVPLFLAGGHLQPFIIHGPDFPAGNFERYQIDRCLEGVCMIVHHPIRNANDLVLLM